MESRSFAVAAVILLAMSACGRSFHTSGGRASGFVPGGGLPEDISIAVRAPRKLATVGNTATVTWNWNDYVRLIPNSEALPCLGNDGEVCAHAGEMRAVWVPGPTSCDGLTAVDQLQFFDWSCDDTQTGGVEFTTARLRSGVTLANLLNNTSFKPNRVTISAGDKALSTELLSWWTNPVVSLDALSPTSLVPGVTISGSGDELEYTLRPALTALGGPLYTFSVSRALHSFKIAQDKVGVVVLGGALLTWQNGPANCHPWDQASPYKCFMKVRGDYAQGTDGEGNPTFSLTQSRKFVWIEGRFNGASTTAGNAQNTLWLAFTHHSRLTNLELSNSNLPLVLDASNANTLLNVRVRNGAQQGVYLYGNRNQVTGLDISMLENPYPWYGLMVAAAYGNVFTNTLVQNLNHVDPSANPFAIRFTSGSNHNSFTDTCFLEVEADPEVSNEGGSHTNDVPDDCPSE